jgi:hypothetical protein
MSKVHSNKKYSWAISAKDYLEQRLEKTDACWNWDGPIDKDGYGQVQCSKYGRTLKTSRAHQMAYIVYKGQYNKNYMICHNCDNTRCCNPTHLYVGSAADNNRDMLSRNRQYYPIGEDASNAKLTRSQVNTIRGLKGINTCFELADRYQVSFGHICRLWRGERYA